MSRDTRLPPARNLRLVTVALAVVLVGFVGWVALGIYGPISLPFQAVEGSISMTSHVEDHHLRVTGTTNLPDGSLIDWFIERHPGGDNPDLPGGQVTVAAGAFTFDADLTGWTGRARAGASFSCNYGTLQPKTTTDRVGEHCEHLVGGQVDADSLGDGKGLSAHSDFDLPSRPSLTDTVSRAPRSLHPVACARPPPVSASAGSTTRE